MTTETTSTRERLLLAARKSFAHKGFHGTTTRDIAAAAGLSPAGVYVHHRSKEDMLYELSRLGHEHLVGLVEDAASGPGGSADRLREIVRVIVVMHAADHESARVVNYEIEALAPEHRAEIEALRTRIQRALRATVQDGVAAGEFHTDEVAMTANAISGMCVDVARWYIAGDRWTPERIADHFAGIALRMVAAG
ncbi:TetR/AcrR family transcriptional regulator [Calidifontibacter indicus]|uniref:TetR/AcrR family transcriptional regulator n=1 Tax=Calidifontibacter indicus TaxID=419650 RepID=UPI003D72B26C